MRQAADAGLALALFAAACAAACTADEPPAPVRTGPPALVFAPGGAFYDTPFPSDARRAPSGAPDLTGMPGLDDADFLADAARLAMRDETGASPAGVVSFRFDAPPPLPDLAAAASTAPWATVFVVDLDPRSPHRGERRPVLAHVVTDADASRPRGLVQLLPLPGVGLRPATTYAAVVLRRVTTPPLARSSALERLLASPPPPSATLARWHASLAPLRAQLPELGLTPADVAAATVFTTGDPAARVTRFVEHVARAPAPELLALERRAASDRFLALRGVVRLPMYQRGEPPYAFGGGALATDDDGLPAPVRFVDAPFELSIPRTPMPKDGYPLYLYVHGTGGRAAQANDRGRVGAEGADAVAPLSGVVAGVAAAEGYATACVAGPFSPDRTGWRALDGYGAYAFFRPEAMRDNFAQMLLEQVHFANLLRELSVAPDRLPGVDLTAAPDGRARFDSSRVVVGGQSLGSYLAGILAATLPRFGGAVLSGAGGNWIEFAFGPKDPVDLQALLEWAALEDDDELDRFHPLLSVFQLALGPADNTHYTRRLFTDPAPLATRPHVLIVEGDPDAQIPTALQAPLVRSFGARLVGAPDDEATLGLQALLGPAARAPARRVSGNVTIEGEPARTVVVSRWQRDAHLDGHHVFFQLDGPASQTRELLAAVREGRVPTIVAPD